MDNSSGYIPVGNKKLHYLRSGSGNKVLLAFHGYGNNANLLLSIAEPLQAQHTLISVDLPHHGNSEWPDTEYLEPAALPKIVTHIQQTFKVEKISLLGYSMGGRVCLKIAEMVPQYIDTIVLLASDGLQFNSFYYFVTRTTPGKYLFNRFLTNPARYTGMIEWARKRNWIDASRYKFAMQYLKAEQDRQFLLKVWPCMAHILPDYKKLKRALNEHKISVHIIMGMHDRVIPVALAKQFKRDTETVTLHIVDKGHRVLDSDTIPLVAQCLLAE